jgi:uncharacterized protein (DUF1800 family)
MATIPVFRRFVTIGIAGALLAAAPSLLARPAAPPALPTDDAAIRHALNRLTFGPRPGDVERVRELGLERYIDQQLHPERVSDAAVDAKLQRFSTLTMSTADLVEQYFGPALEMRRRQQATGGAPPPGPTSGSGTDARAPQAGQGVLPGPQRVVNELMQAKVLRAVESERQLQEVLTDFWFNHFNVFVGKNMVRQYLTEYERDVIRPHTLGSFRDLLGAVAKSPAMLLYLDNWQSSAPGEPADLAEIERRLRGSQLPPATRQRMTERLQQMRQRPARGLNENYARELLELHTLGVDGGYTQDDVVALARILTGWTIDQPRQGGGFVFRQPMHDAGTKTLLGRTFGASGQSEGEFALDLLASHPSTAKHIATKLARRFVADEPPATVVDRATSVFLQTKGDLRQVLRAIVTSPEFFAEPARRAKVKTPLEFVVSAVRATGASVESAQPLVAALQTLGMPLYGSQPPTGYGTSASDWVNTGALLGRMNFAVALVAGGRGLQQAARGPGPAVGTTAAPGRPNAARRPQPVTPVRMDIATLAPGTDAVAQTNVIDALLGGVASDATRRTLERAASPQQLIALTLGSPEFQRH